MGVIIRQLLEHPLHFMPDINQRPLPLNQPIHFLQGTNQQRLAQLLEHTVQMRQTIQTPPLEQPMHFLQGTNKRRLAQVLENTVQMRNIIRATLRDPFRHKEKITFSQLGYQIQQTTSPVPQTNQPFHLLDSSEVTTMSTVGVEETTDQKVGKGKPVRRF